MNRIIEFLFEVGMLKRTPRTGYQFLGSGEESVAEHSFRTTVLGYVLARGEPEADTDRVLRMCLFHDLPEARTGDHNYVNKKYVMTDEKKAVSDQTRDLPFADEIVALMNEFNGAETLEARIAKDADQLDLILNLKEQYDLGNPNAKQWLSFALKRLNTNAGQRLGDQIMKSKSDAWWFDKDDEDWWVNGDNKKG